VKIGMANFSSLVTQYGGVAPALAAYNAGDSRVTRWLAERRDLDQDEFIDDIPFPETQNYVKRIIGTADDYRALYADLRPGQLEDAAIRKPAPSVKPAASKSGSTVKPAAKSTSKSAPKKTTTSKRRTGTRRK
jgi:soluble lytic murein transglycosylase